MRHNILGCAFSGSDFVNLDDLPVFKDSYRSRMVSVRVL